MYNWTAELIGTTDFLGSAFSVQISSPCEVSSMKICKCYSDYRFLEEMFVHTYA